MDGHENALDQQPAKSEATPVTISIPPASSMLPGTPQTFPVINIDKGVKNLDISTSQEETRAKIAMLFTKAFLWLVTFCLIVPFAISIVDKSVVSDPAEYSKNLLTSVASILAGPFGFIVGFYFKLSARDED